MSETITDAAFAAWEAQQPLAIEVVDGLPMCQHDEHQGPSRLARVWLVAREVLADETAAIAKMRTPKAELGGLGPEAPAGDGEDRCQLVPRALLAIGRRRPVPDTVSSVRVGPIIVLKDADGMRHAVGSRRHYAHQRMGRLHRVHHRDRKPDSTDPAGVRGVPS